MDRRVLLLSFGLALAMSVDSAAAGQHEGHQAGATPSAAQVTECRQAQPVIAGLLNAALKRLEDARLTNSGTAMRDAADDVQAALIDIRTQLAPCSVMQPAPTEAQAGSAAPATPGASAAAGTKGTQPSPAPVAADPHAGHAAPPASTSRTPAATAARPSARPQGSASPAAGSHAGHTTPAAPASRTPPASARPSASARPAPAPPASDAHAGHAAAPAPASPAKTGSPGRTGAAAPPTNIAKLKCSNAVDPKTAPRLLYQGRMYYFCTVASRAEFAKDPAKFVTAPPQAVPAHAH